MSDGRPARPPGRALPWLSCPTCWLVAPPASRGAVWRGESPCWSSVGHSCDLHIATDWPGRHGHLSISRMCTGIISRHQRHSRASRFGGVAIDWLVGGPILYHGPCQGVEGVARLADPLIHLRHAAFDVAVVE